METQLAQLYHLLLESALEAGPILRKHQPTVVNEGKTGAPGDSAGALAKTKIDEALQELVLARVLRHFPGIEVNAEEDTALRYLFRGNRHPICLHVDPCDGTLSYLEQLPEYCAGYGISVRGVFTHCVLHLPAMNRIFTATPAGNTVLDSSGSKQADLPSTQPAPVIFQRHVLSPAGVKAMEAIGYTVRSDILCSHQRIVDVARGHATAFLYRRHKIHDSCLPSPFLINAGGHLLDLEGRAIQTDRIPVDHASGLPEFSPLPAVLYLAPRCIKTAAILEVLADPGNLHQDE